MASLKTQITISDEVGDRVIVSTGIVDLLSGEITDVRYVDYDLKADGVPAASPDYDYTSGLLVVLDKELEFAIDVDPATGAYDVNPDELEEVRAKAALLAGGGSGKPASKKKR